MDKLSPDEKFKLYVSVILKAMEFRREPVKMAEYILKNKKFFPSIKDEDMHNIIENYPSGNR